MSQRNPTRRIIYDGRRYITLRFSQRQGVSSALFISPHFLLQFHLNSHRLQFLSHFSGVIAWERCTSTSKTKAASLFCWRGRGTNRGKDGRRWRKGKMEGVQVGGCRCGGRMFHKLSRVSVGENITSSSCRKGSTWRSRRSKTPTQVCTNCFKSLEDVSNNHGTGSVHPWDVASQELTTFFTTIGSPITVFEHVSSTNSAC